MKRSIWIAIPALVVCVLVAHAQTLPMGTTPDHAYVGADKCVFCHKAESKGNQAQKWMDSRHSHAYETLGSDAAKKIAAEKGLGDPQKEDACLVCHVTGWGAPEEFRTMKWRIDEGVGCEACHGPGADYWKMSVMKVKADAIKAGLHMPDEKTCLSCHNEKSPSYKPFNFEERWAEINHDNPLTSD